MSAARSPATPAAAGKDLPIKRFRDAAALDEARAGGEVRGHARAG